MQSEKTFKTKTGYCHILPDKIVLTRDGIVGDAANVKVENNIKRILLTYSIIAAGIFYFAYVSFKKGETVQPILLCLLGVFLVYGILTSLNNSDVPVIDRNKIKTIKLKKAIPWLTRSGFEVLFEDQQGKVKKRLIMLPGSLTGGKAETEKAIRIMTEEYLLTIH